MQIGQFIQKETFLFSNIVEAASNVIYYVYYVLKQVESNWNMDQQFVVNYVQTVMGTDATIATNPMSNENANSEEDLDRMVNSITYNKGATVIRMTKHILGEDKFKISLTDYLNTQ